MHLLNNRRDGYPGQADPFMLKFGGKYRINESGVSAFNARICKLHVQDGIITGEHYQDCV